MGIMGKIKRIVGKNIIGKLKCIICTQAYT